MTSTTQQALFVACCLALLGCEDPPVDDGGDDGPSGADCQQLDAPSVSQLIDEQDIARIEALPYYASAAIDLPGGAERLGNAQLEIDADGSTRLHVRAAGPRLLRSVFIELDLTGALIAEGGALSAQATNESPFGSISVNGEDGVFFQGGIGFAGFESQSSGVFALDIQPVDFTIWPPEEQVDGQAFETIAAFTDQPIRVVGRLHGACMGETNGGQRARVMDLATRPDCEAIIGHL